jgi:hypothetical protein
VLLEDVVPSDLREVAEVRDSGESGGEDCAGVSVELGERDDSVSDLLESEIESPAPGAEGDDCRLMHSGAGSRRTAP